MAGVPRRQPTEAEAKTLASGTRLRILRVCLDEALTNREIADRLGLNPGTTLHHVRRLVDTGFLAAQKVRRGVRGSREIPYRATGKSWETVRLDEHLALGGRAMVDAFVQEAALVNDADHITMSRLGLRLTREEHEELSRRLTGWLDELAAGRRQTGGRPYSLFVSLYPDVTRDARPPPAAS